MNKILFKSKQEHWEWAWKNYIRFYHEFDPSPWLPEDLLVMQPFFDYEKKARHGNPEWTTEAAEGLEHYKKISDLPDRCFRDNIDVVREVDMQDLLEYMGFQYTHKEDEQYVDDPDWENGVYEDGYAFSLEEPPACLKGVSYPCVFLYSFQVEYDRVGKAVVLASEFVFLEDFKDGKNDQKGTMLHSTETSREGKPCQI